MLVSTESKIYPTKKLRMTTTKSKQQFSKYNLVNIFFNALLFSQMIVVELQLFSNGRIALFF